MLSVLHDIKMEELLLPVFLFNSSCSREEKASIHQWQYVSGEIILWEKKSCSSIEIHFLASDLG